MCGTAPKFYNFRSGRDSAYEITMKRQESGDILFRRLIGDLIIQGRRRLIEFRQSLFQCGFVTGFQIAQPDQSNAHCY
jgi:hypothetical protein